MATSWAALVQKAPAVQAAAPSLDDDAEAAAALRSARLAILDANALISGLQLAGVADRFMTIEEVLGEVRDKQSRQLLASLPFKLEVKEPSEESIAAGEGRAMCLQPSMMGILCSRRCATCTHPFLPQSLHLRGSRVICTRFPRPT